MVDRGRNGRIPRVAHVDVGAGGGAEANLGSGESADGPAGPRQALRRRWARPVDQVALAVWAGSWLGVMMFVAIIPRVLPTVFAQVPYLDRWAQWDAVRFIKIAIYGYAGPPNERDDPGWPAFFPGYPLLLRAVGAVLPHHDGAPDYRLAGLAISMVAGAATLYALGRLGEFEGPEGTGSRAAIAIVASPQAVFLFAGYSESVFLALALPAWLLARRGEWAWAAVLTALSAGVRITGLFLAIALVVEYLVGQNGRRRVGWAPMGWLLLPAVPLLAYTVYQHGRTGDWLAWQHAQEKGWSRKLTNPIDAFKTTFNSGFRTDWEFTLAFRIEVVAALVGVILVVALLVLRRWPELVYVGLQLAALMLSSYYMSIGRATLLWWPLWIGLGVVGVRRPAVYAGLMALSIPFAALLLITFTSGGWAG